LDCSPSDFRVKLKEKGIITSGRWGTIVRLVTHYGIEKEDIDYVIETFHDLFGKKS
jgi:Cys-tRNA synthase (O-phospho-L-seryl-tRNA:Cys-tRNA synthase)